MHRDWAPIQLRFEEKGSMGSLGGKWIYPPANQFISSSILLQSAPPYGVKVLLNTLDDG